MLYSYKGQEPAPLPERIRLSDGSTRTDSSTFTEEEIADAGYVIADSKPAATSSNKVVYWLNEQWNERDANEAELNAQWQIVRKKRDELLREADIRLMLSIERKVDDDYIGDYKQNLRDVPQLNTNPFSILWPEYGDDTLTYANKVETGFSVTHPQQA
jgi:hypothetical protein